MKDRTPNVGKCGKPNVSCVLPAAILAVALFSSCAQDGELQSNTDASIVTVAPDFTRLTTNGTTCETGDARPCFQLLRPQPTRQSSDYVNAVVQRPDGPHAEWPYESYKGSKADKVDIVCQVKGDVTQNAAGKKSEIWDVVLVPWQHLNQEAITEATTASPRFGVVKDKLGQLVAIYAFAPDMWLQDHGVYKVLPTCSSQQNPHAYPTVR